MKESNNIYQARSHIVIIMIFILIYSCVMIPSNDLPSTNPNQKLETQNIQVLELPPKWTETSTMDQFKEVTKISRESDTLSKTPTIMTNSPTLTKIVDCNPNEVLSQLKEVISIEEFVITFNILDMPSGYSSLVIWFVDSEINPKAQGLEIELNGEIAMQHAAMISTQLNNSNKCVASLFDVINPIVVDSKYNGWFSGEIMPNRLPNTNQVSNEQLATIIDAYKIVFLRDKPTTVFTSEKTGTCSWPEVHNKLHLHFSSTRENVGFYFVLDDVGTNVWAQWDGSTDPLQLTVNLQNIVMELECLYPPPDRVIIIVVNEDGIVELLGIVPGLNISGLQIAYQR